jgi:hypothetical protein
LGGETRAGVYPDTMSCGNRQKKGLFMHPPWQGGVGYAFALYDPVPLPAEPPAAFRCSIGKRDGSDPGDGILFRVAVVETTSPSPSRGGAGGGVGQPGKETLITERPWIEHAWTELEGDLTPWAGKTVRLKLIADVGLGDNSVGDWACWSEMRIESREPVLGLTLTGEPVSLRYEDGPYPVAGLSVADLRAARRGWLHYEGMGMESREPYLSYGTLNGVALGPLPGAGGSEVEGRWSEVQSVPLPPEALAVLAARNRFVLDNPGQDWFKVRRFWIELELADGRKCSSQVFTPVFTQPPNWLYAEGTGVPFGEAITAEVRFAVAE